MTARTIFNITMDLINKRLPTGIIPKAKVEKYEVKAPSILSIGQSELLQKLNQEYAGVIVSLEDELTLDDKYSTTLLSYFLATHLMLEEKDDLAVFFNSRYEELKATSVKSPATEKEITDVYGWW